jgi:cysteinyl-tRNA synthetase
MASISVFLTMKNEIAQPGRVPGKRFVSHWFHSEHLQLEGEKMSKSLGNLFTLADSRNKGHDVSIVRYALISDLFDRS